MPDDDQNTITPISTILLHLWGVEGLSKVHLILDHYTDSFERVFVLCHTMAPHLAHMKHIKNTTKIITCSSTSEKLQHNANVIAQLATYNRYTHRLGFVSKLIISNCNRSPIKCQTKLYLLYYAIDQSSKQDTLYGNSHKCQMTSFANSTLNMILNLLKIYDDTRIDFISW